MYIPKRMSKDYMIRRTKYKITSYDGQNTSIPAYFSTIVCNFRHS